MTDPKELQKRFEEAVAHTATDAMFTYRPMFGGILAYADGRPCGSFSDVGLALKLAPADQEELLGIEGACRLRYEPDSPPSKTYITVPPGFLKDGKKLGAWIVRSAEYVRSLPMKKKKS